MNMNDYTNIKESYDKKELGWTKKKKINWEIICNIVIKASSEVVFDINILANPTLKGKNTKKISLNSKTNKIHFELVLNVLWISAWSCI